MKSFHPDLTEPWGTGTVIAQFCGVIANYYTSNFDLGKDFSFYFGVMGFISIALFAVAFVQVERIKRGEHTYSLNQIHGDDERRESPKEHSYNIMNNIDFTYDKTIDLLKRTHKDMRNMFALQFWNDLFLNCIIVIDIASRQEIQQHQYELYQKQ